MVRRYLLHEFTVKSSSYLNATLQWYGSETVSWNVQWSVFRTVCVYGGKILITSDQHRRRTMELKAILVVLVHVQFDNRNAIEIINFIKRTQSPADLISRVSRRRTARSSGVVCVYQCSLPQDIDSASIVRFSWNLLLRHPSSVLAESGPSETDGGKVADASQSYWCMVGLTTLRCKLIASCRHTSVLWGQEGEQERRKNMYEFAARIGQERCVNLWARAPMCRRIVEDGQLVDNDACCSLSRFRWQWYARWFESQPSNYNCSFSACYIGLLIFCWCVAIQVSYFLCILHEIDTVCHHWEK